MPTPHVYYERVDRGSGGSPADAGPTGVHTGTWRPTEHVQGAWNDHEQHMAPVAGLLAHELESYAPRPDLTASRFSYEILGLIPLEQTMINCRVVRPGRTIELVEAVLTTVSAPDRPVIRASVWRLSRQDTAAISRGPAEPLPPAAEMGDWAGLTQWPGGFIRSLQGRTVEADTPGRRLAWLHSDVALVDEPASATATFLRLVDAANGIAATLNPYEWMFPNTDLQIHLWRTPGGDRTGYDTIASIGPDGVGVTQTVLHDEHGPVGRATQLLTVRPAPGSARVSGAAPATG
ncbi:thioesterase family protein [Propionibacteriaceae bacterium Y2011]